MLPTTEPLDALYTNMAVLGGRVSEYGVRTVFEKGGRQRVSFALQVKEANAEQTTP